MGGFACADGGVSTAWSDADGSFIIGYETAMRILAYEKRFLSLIVRETAFRTCVFTNVIEV